MGSDRVACRPEPWYHRHRFAVLPYLRTRAADEQNTWSFHLHWLVFRVWSLDSVDTGIEICLDDQQLIVRGRIPYLVFGAFIPVFPRWMMQRFWRKSRLMKRFAREEKERKATGGGRDDG